MKDDSHSDSERIIDIRLDERTVARRSPEIENERRTAISDLLEENQFALRAGGKGPYQVALAVREGRLIVEVHGSRGALLEQITVPLSPFRALVKDYFLVCESYFNALKDASPYQIETLDMGRRGLHDEGSELLRDRLSGKVQLDLNTARRLFTLICVLHLRA